MINTNEIILTQKEFDDLHFCKFGFPVGESDVYEWKCLITTGHSREQKKGWHWWHGSFQIVNQEAKTVYKRIKVKGKPGLNGKILVKDPVLPKLVETPETLIQDYSKTKAKFSSFKKTEEVVFIGHFYNEPKGILSLDTASPEEKEYYFNLANDYFTGSILNSHTLADFIYNVVAQTFLVKNSIK